MAQLNHATATIDGKSASRSREGYQTASGSPRTIGQGCRFVLVSKLRPLGRNTMRARFQGPPVKRVRRISLSVEHREVSVSIAQTVVTSGESRPTPTPGDAGQPENCRDCGAPWIIVTAHSGENATANIASIHRALQQCGAHMHVSATGELRICSKSFDEIRFQKIKESL